MGFKKAYSRSSERFLGPELYKSQISKLEERIEKLHIEKARLIKKNLKLEQGNKSLSERVRELYYSPEPGPGYIESRKSFKKKSKKY